MLIAREQNRPASPGDGRNGAKYQERIDPRRLVFVDETWAKTNMTRLRGWSRRGCKLVDKVPHGHWRTLTFLAALRSDRIDVPLVLDGPIDAQSFTARVEQFLLPYSPDLNPLEQVFANLKTLLRKADARSLKATWRQIGSLLDAFPPHGCANYLRNSGYAPC